jgi:uncharacterized protein
MSKKKENEKLQNNFISENIEIVNYNLFFRKENILAIGDLHLGQEEELNKTGILIPRKNFERVKSELEKVFEKIGKIKTIVLMGDIKHEFGLASNQEWREVIELLELLEKNSKKIILLKGNHDNYIKAIARWKDFEIQEKFEINDYCFCHGNKIIKTAKKIIVIGHEHAAITLKDEYKNEKFKCFGKTKFENKEVIILPSFNFLTTGTDLLKERLISEYLKKTKEFEIWIVEEGKSFYFGKMKKTF